GHARIAPGTGELMFEGHAPDVHVTGDVGVVPGVADLVFTGHAPTVRVSGAETAALIVRGVTGPARPTRPAVSGPGVPFVLAGPGYARATDGPATSRVLSGPGV